MGNDETVRGQAGGQARAEILPPEKKRDIARKGALARWGARAIHTGNFKAEFGIDVDCYVLDDAEKTAVVSQTGLARSLGFSARANAVPKFLASRAMAQTGGAELAAKIQNPLKFQWGTGGAGAPPSIVHGFDVGCYLSCRANASGLRFL